MPKSVRVKNLPGLEYEKKAGFPRVYVAGADEVGRGCLAGPVVAGAVILPTQVNYEDHPWLEEVNDSKKVTPLVRERLAPLITKWALATGIGIATVEEIDEINIFHASHLAIMRAVNALRVKPNHVLIDGKFLPKQGISIAASAVVKGDQKCLSIAAASIIAKVWRDQHMMELDQKFPDYGFAQHKGYPTVAHSQALKKQGVTEVHRRSFKLL